MWLGLKLFFSLFYPLKKQVYFRAYGGLQYSCNPRCISEMVHEKNPDVRIVWVFSNPDVMDTPDYVCKVKKNTFQDFKALFTSKIWVMNAGMVIPFKRKGQIFIDTWHGDRAFKNVTMDIHGCASGIAYTKVDYVLSGSDYGDRVFLEQLNVKSEILKVGSPRNDLFFGENKALRQEVKKRLHLESFDHVLMFAPTFREYKIDEKRLDFSKLIEMLNQRDSAKWCVLIRQHHKAVYDSSWENDERIFNVSKYPEMAELLLLSDVVISDYSSLVGDYVLQKRPVVLYVPDLENYKAGRGLNFDLEKSPFVYAQDETDLFDKIVNLDETSAKKNCEDILDFYGHVADDGHATERVTSFILEKL